MSYNSTDDDYLGELTLDDEQPTVAQDYVASESAATDEVVHEPVFVPVESLGAGVVNFLGEMVGGLIGLKGPVQQSLEKGAQIVKDKVEGLKAKKTTPHDEETIILDQEPMAEQPVQVAREEDPHL
ncbi:MAG: hypothetical protein HQL70_01855 [Magnetococcales bacterium]|nr:hypothetical protein [Magnetococcales bacterium]